MVMGSGSFCTPVAVATSVSYKGQSAQLTDMQGNNAFTVWLQISHNAGYLRQEQLYLRIQVFQNKHCLKLIKDLFERPYQKGCFLKWIKVPKDQFHLER